MSISILLTGKCLDRSDVLHKVFISDCDNSKTTQKWEMNNIVAVWRVEEHQESGNGTQWLYEDVHTDKRTPRNTSILLSLQVCQADTVLFEEKLLLQVSQHDGVRESTVKSFNPKLLAPAENLPLTNFSP